MSTSPAIRTSSEFRRGLIGTIVVLVLACAGLGTASVLQGPRIQGAQLDVAAAVVAPASLRMVFNEAVAPIEAADVVVEPAVPVTVQNDGDVVFVQFEHALDYDTDYSISITGVRAAAGGVSVDVGHDIRTPPFQPTWLQRSPSGDRVLTGTLGAEPTTLFTAARIQDYVQLDPHALFVVTVDDDGASSAAIVASDGSGNAEEIVLPGGEPGAVEQLALVASNVLFSFTSAPSDDVPVFDQTLFRLDLGGSHIPEPVIGIDGEALAIDTLIPIPGTTAALLHTRAGEVLRYDPTTDEPPTLVGKYPELVALAGDGHRLSVKDAFGPLIFDLDDGSETRIEPSPIEGTQAVPFVADVIPIRDGRHVERAVLPNADFTAFDSFVAIDDGTEASLLFRTVQPIGSILDYRVTANDAYLVAEISPGGDSFEAGDGYGPGARPRDVTTVVIDIAAGDVVGEWQGSHPRW